MECILFTNKIKACTKPRKILIKNPWILRDYHPICVVHRQRVQVYLSYSFQISNPR